MSAPKSDKITAVAGPAMKLEKSTTFSPEKILSFMLTSFDGQRARETEAFWSLAFEDWLALFAECSHAFSPIRGCETLSEERRLDIQSLAKALVEPAMRRVDRQFHCNRSIRIDLVQNGFRPRNEIVLGH